jgi:alpha-L-rhamnosidase
LCLLFILAGAARAQATLSSPIGSHADLTSVGSQIYLPVMLNAGDFYRNQPIWAPDSQSGAHQVVLFRIEFNLSQSLTEVELTLFADTRYQVWLDGNWVGRGPARFALTYRQYDVYALESLAPGEHVLAVLVQWSPDDRRSESLRPLLQGAIQGNLPDGSPFVLRTGSDWKALLSPAWRDDAALIHPWGLIGFSELLDLSQLPVDWNQPGFSAADWHQAVVVDPSTELLSPIRYSRRDIAFPINEAVPVTLIDSGSLMPGRAIGELPIGTPSPYYLPFQADSLTPFSVETLGAGVSPAESLILLDGGSLIWQPAGPLRPDIYRAQVELPAGAHTLTFNPPAEGLTFAISTANLSGLDLPFQQGNHAGRRLLLAEPANQPGAVVANPGALNSLEFTQLPAFAVIDLGRVTHGRITAQVSGAAGTVIDIGWDERLLEGTLRPLPYPGSLHSYWNQTDSWILDGTTRQLTTIDARSGRYILIAVWGSGPVRLDDLVITSEHYPLTQVGTFHSSDPLLEQIWQIGVDTVQLNMVDAYMDPWRERGQWWGDSFVIDQVNAVAFGDASLLRRGLLLMQNAFPETQAPGCAPHNNNLHMLDYAMLWVHSLSDYASRTGDSSLLVESYPTLQAFIHHLESYQNPETGLLDLPKTSWSETAYIDTLAYSSRYGQSTALNAMYAATLLKAATIAAQVGDTANHDLWQMRAEAVKASLNTWLYLPEQGRYLTNIYAGVAYPPTLYAQAWPLAYGLVPEGEQDRVVSALLELLSADPATPNVGTYGFYWILDGLGKAGYSDQALTVMKSYYGRMIERGATTWWENFLADQNYSQALSHGWGSAPTWFLTTYVLGARQVAPGVWTLQPAIYMLEHAAGTLPMPQGALQISWQSSGCTSGDASGLTRLALNAPPDTHGQLTLPFDQAVAWITLDGIGIPPNLDASTENPGEISIPLDAGSHTIEIGTACAALP